MSNWTNFATVTLDGINNVVPGGTAYHYENLPAGVYRFRVDPNSQGVNYNKNIDGFAYCKAAAVMLLNRPTDSTPGVVYYYALNDADGLASEAIHAVSTSAGFDLYLQDWNRFDNLGSVTVIVEQWAQ